MTEAFLWFKFEWAQPAPEGSVSCGIAACA